MTIGIAWNNTTLNFTYDASGTPMSVSYGSATYYYVTNLQGDVVAILNSSGTSVVTYTYDAWGKLLTTSGSMASTLGVHNPLRYRGYVYDTDSGLYYLQSRYYNPTLGRFINGDALVSTGQGLVGNNMFAYCLNNPVNFVDSCGTTTEALQWWLGSMWWLCGVDTVLPFGDLLYTIGTIVFLCEFFTVTSDPVIIVDNNDSNVGDNTSTSLDQSSLSTPGSPEPPDKNNNKKPSLKKLTQYLIQKLRIDPHELKYEYLGKGAQVKLYDLAYDTVTGIVYIITKTGQIVAETYLNVLYDSLLW